MTDKTPLQREFEKIGSIVFSMNTSRANGNRIGLTDGIKDLKKYAQDKAKEAEKLRELMEQAAKLLFRVKDHTVSQDQYLMSDIMHFCLDELEQPEIKELLTLSE